MYGLILERVTWKIWEVQRFAFGRFTFRSLKTSNSPMIARNKRLNIYKNHTFFAFSSSPGACYCYRAAFYFALLSKGVIFPIATLTEHMLLWKGYILTPIANMIFFVLELLPAPSLEPLATLLFNIKSAPLSTIIVLIRSASV